MMMQKLYQKISSLVALSSSNPPLGRRVLLYHAIGNKVADDHNGLCTVSSHNFKEQIKLLKDLNHFQFKGLTDAQTAESKELVFTFDDGYLDNLTIAAPILCSMNIPFTVFVISDFVKQSQREYLTAKDLKELSQMPGVTIGSHGQTHRPFTQLSAYELNQELINSKAYLEDIIQKPVTALSYPHGKTKPELKKLIKDNGYNLAGCSLFGINLLDTDAYFIKRTSILSTDNLKSLKQKVLGHWDWFALRQKMQN